MSRTLIFIMLSVFTITAASSAAFVDNAKEDKKEERKPVLSCDTYSLRSLYADGKLTHLTAPALMKELEIPGITFNDIWFESWDKEYLDRIKAACAESGIRITGVIAEGNMVSDDQEAVRKQLETNKMKIRAAAYLGAPIIRLNVGGTGRAEDDGTVGVQRAIASFNELVPLAKEMNVKLTIENHGGVSKHGDWILAIVKGTDPEWVGVCLDFGNWSEDVRYVECKKLAPYSYHTHAKCNPFFDRGEQGRKDFGRVLGYMQDVDYRYAVSIEYEGRGDQIEGVKASRDLILEYWPELKDNR